MGGCISGRLSNATLRASLVLAGAMVAAGVCAGASAAAQDAESQGKVTGVRFWSLGDATRVAIEVSSDFHFQSDRLSNPDRLFFDIHGAKPGTVSKGMQAIPVGDSLLKQIRVAETQPGVTRVVLDLTQNVEFKASQLSNPSRLMIELRLKDRTDSSETISSAASEKRNGDPRESASPIPAKLASVENSASRDMSAPAQAAAQGATGTRGSSPRPFVPPSPPAAEAKVTLLRPPVLLASAKPPRVPFAIPISAPRSFLPPRPSSDLVAVKEVSPARPNAIGPELLKPTKTAPVLASDPLPAKRDANGNRSLTRVLGLKLGRVVLDPGHGGHDVGTHGPSGLYEKDVVLDISQRLGALIEARLGSEVIYTRSDDTFIPLEERTRIANDHKADLFLSIHANSSPIRTAAGVETYYLNFTTSKAAMDVAARENAGSGGSIYDLQDLLQKIALKDKIDESREFASRLQTALYNVSAKANDAAKNRGVKKAPFVVLIGASMPSVLAEIGFLSNSADETLLRKPEQRQKIAEALYKGIASYAETLSHFQVAAK